MLDSGQCVKMAVKCVLFIVPGQLLPSFFREAGGSCTAHFNAMHKRVVCTRENNVRMVQNST